MGFWRMQLHPDDSKKAISYTIDSLSSHFIGLNYSEGDTDLTIIPKDEISNNPNHYKSFVYDIKENDWVLIMAHNKPFAILTGINEYNYIKTPIQRFKLWFQHIREFKYVSYYSDLDSRIRNEYDGLVLTNTFSSLTLDSKSGKLMTAWINELKRKGLFPLSETEKH